MVDSQKPKSPNDRQKKVTVDNPNQIQHNSQQIKGIGRQTEAKRTNGRQSKAQPSTDKTPFSQPTQIDPNDQ